MDDRAVAVILIVAGVLIWVGWPLSVFAIGIGVVAFIVKMRPGDQGSPLEVAVRKALYETALFVLIGLGMVWMCQIVFAVHPGDSDAVKRGEATLIHLRERLKWTMGIGPLLVVAVTALLATLFKPQWRIGPMVAVLRRWVERLLLVVSTVTSFTFFTGVDIADHEGDWVASRRTEMNGDKAEIARSQRQIAALATIEVAWNASEDKPREVAAYLKAAAAISDHDPEVVRDIAESLGNAEPVDPVRGESLIRLPHLDNSTLPSPTVSKPVDNGLEDKPVDDGLDDVEVVAEADRANDRRKRLTLALKEGRTQLQQLFSKGLENLIPERAKGFVEPFLEKLADTIAEKAVDRVYPDSVEDLQSAVLWTQLQRTPESWNTWDWRHVDVPGMEDVASNHLPATETILPTPSIDAVRYQIEHFDPLFSLRTKTLLRNELQVDERTDAERIGDEFGYKVATTPEESGVASASENYVEVRTEIGEPVGPREAFRATRR